MNKSDFENPSMQLMNIKIDNFEIERFNVVRKAIGKILNNESVYAVITLHNGLTPLDLRHT